MCAYLSVCVCRREGKGAGPQKAVCGEVKGVTGKESEGWDSLFLL